MLTADWSVTISVFTGKVKKIKIICILDLLTEMDWNKQIDNLQTARAVGPPKHRKQVNIYV